MSVKLPLPRAGRDPRYSGFTNQQLLLLLLICFPIALIIVGMVVTLAQRSAPQRYEPVRDVEPSSRMAPDPVDQSTQPSGLPPVQSGFRGQSSGSEEMARRDLSAPRPCHYQDRVGGLVESFTCNISTRSNVRGDRVVVVRWSDGETSNYVFRGSGVVETWYKGKQDVGSYRQASLEGAPFVRIDARKDRDVTWLPMDVLP
jgi:hypothetical protein